MRHPTAAKAAVVALTATAALEYAPTIRVNAVSPGMVRTALTQPLFDTFEGIEDEMVARTPLHRVGEPEEIAGVLVFLCSDLARFMTGQNLVVDGGHDVARRRRGRRARPGAHHA